MFLLSQVRVLASFISLDNKSIEFTDHSVKKHTFIQLVSTFVDSLEYVLLEDKGTIPMSC